MIRRPFQVAVGGVLLAASLSAGARTWTNALGRTFEAEFVRMDGGNVIFVLPEGRAFSSPLADLSPTDRAALQVGATGRRAIGGSGGANLQPALAA